MTGPYDSRERVLLRGGADILGSHLCDCLRGEVRYFRESLADLECLSA